MSGSAESRTWGEKETSAAVVPSPGRERSWMTAKLALRNTGSSRLLQPLPTRKSAHTSAKVWSNTSAAVTCGSLLYANGSLWPLNTCESSRCSCA